MLKKITLTLLITLSVIGCSYFGKNKTIPRDNLVKLLVDLHISDAIATNAPLSELFHSPDSATVYSTILESHGYTKTQLEQSIEYYSSDPKVLTEIYDEVFADITKKSEEVKAIEAMTTWPMNKTLFRSEKPLPSNDSMQYPVVYDFPIDSAGIYIFSANIKLPIEDSSVNPRIVVSYYNPSAPNKERFWKEVPMLKSKFARDYDLIDTLTDNSFTHIKIRIAQHDSVHAQFAKKLYITRLSVQKYTKQ